MVWGVWGRQLLLELFMMNFVIILKLLVLLLMLGNIPKKKKKGLPELQQHLLQDILKDTNILVRNVYDGVAEIKKRLS